MPTPFPSPTPRLAGLREAFAALAVALLPTAPALARQAPATPPGIPTIGSGERLSLRGLGVSIEPPPGTIWSVGLREDGAPRAFLAEPSESPRWTLAIERYLCSDRGEAAPEAIDEAIEFLEALRSDRIPFTIRVNRPLEVGGRVGHLLLVEMPLAAAEANGEEPVATAITGFLTVPRDGREFVAFRIAALSESLGEVLPILEQMLATATVESSEAMRSWERGVLDAGRRRSAAISASRLLEIADGTPRWHRVYRRGEQGALIELGSFVVRAEPAPLGRLDPARDPENLRPSEQEPGILVSVEARMLPPDSGPAAATEMLDLNLRAWVALDRSSEQWSLRRTIRGDRREPTAAETGIRAAPTTAQPRSVLEVIESSRESMSRAPRQWTLPDEPWLSQAEAILVGPLLAEVAAAGGEFAWRGYDRRLGEVTRRLEQVVPLSDPPGAFELRTLAHPDDPAPMIQRFDSSGALLERRDPDGTITVPIPLEELRRLWTRKGLPLD